jgi:small subunit ribosomal protein S16
VSVRIRMKRMGRSHQHFFRICAIDRHAPNHGRVLEELGTYDPRVKDTDARALLKGDRVAYWLSVGAEPSEKVAVLIKKYGADGTRIDAQKAALDRMAQPKKVPDPGEPVSKPKPPKSKDAPAEEAAAPESAEATEEPAGVGAAAEAEATAEE